MNKFEGEIKRLSSYYIKFSLVKGVIFWHYKGLALFSDGKTSEMNS